MQRGDARRFESFVSGFGIFSPGLNGFSPGFLLQFKTCMFRLIESCLFVNWKPVTNVLCAGDWDKTK